MKRLLVLMVLPLALEAQTFKLQYRGGQMDTAISAALRPVYVELILDSTVLTTTRKYSFISAMEDSLLLDTLMALGSTSCNLTLQMTYDFDRSASGTNVFSSAQTVNSSTVGNKFSTFNNGTIPKNAHSWLTTPTLTTIPRELVVIARFRYKRLR